MIRTSYSFASIGFPRYLIDGKPVLIETTRAAAAARQTGGAAFGRVHGRGPDVLLRRMEKARQRVGGRLRRPGFAQRGEERGGLGGVCLRTGFVEALLRLSVEGVQTRLVELLALRQRLSNQEIQKLRRVRLDRPRSAVDRRHEDAAELPQRRKLRGGEKARHHLRRGVGERGLQRGTFPPAAWGDALPGRVAWLPPGAGCCCCATRAGAAGSASNPLTKRR